LKFLRKFSWRIDNSVVKIDISLFEKAIAKFEEILQLKKLQSFAAQQPKNFRKIG